jgi:H/ACA ribonucleoprotein complex subunit 2
LAILNPFLTLGSQCRLCVIAGDISPIDVITHLPVLCEESEIKYIYVPSKDDLGSSALTKRPTSCVLISNKKGTDVSEKMGSILEEVKEAWASYKH